MSGNNKENIENNQEENQNRQECNKIWWKSCWVKTQSIGYNKLFIGKLLFNKFSIVIILCILLIGSSPIVFAVSL